MFATLRRKSMGWPEIILMLCVVVYWSVVGSVKIAAYNLSVLTSDLAYHANALWNTGPSQGILYSNWAYQMGGGYVTMLQDHFYLTLLLLAPLYHLFPTPLLLVLISAVFPGIAAILLYVLGRKMIHSRWLALIPALAFLSYPHIVKATLQSVYGFHTDDLVTVPLVAAAIALQSREMKSYLLLALITMGVKENIPFTGILAGLEMIVYGLYVKDRFFVKAGGGTIFVAAVLLSIGVVGLPLWSGLPSQHTGRGLQNILVLLTNQEALKQWVTIFVMLPSVLAPEIALLTLPDIILYSASGYSPFDGWDWHLFPSATLLALATVAGLARLNRVAGWFGSTSFEVLSARIPESIRRLWARYAEWEMLAATTLTILWAGFLCLSLYNQLMYPYLWIRFSDLFFYGGMASLLGFVLLIQRRLGDQVNGIRIFLSTFALVIAFCAIVSAYHIDYYAKFVQVNDQKVSMDDVKAINTLIPPESRLAVSTDLLIHFTNRRELVWPNMSGAEYILVNTRLVTFEPDAEFVGQVTERARRGELEFVARRGWLVLYRVITSP